MYKIVYFFWPLSREIERITLAREFRQIHKLGLSGRAKHKYCWQKYDEVDHLNVISSSTLVSTAHCTALRLSWHIAYRLSDTNLIDQKNSCCCWAAVTMTNNCASVTWVIFGFEYFIRYRNSKAYILHLSSGKHNWTLITILSHFKSSNNLKMNNKSSHLNSITPKYLNHFWFACTK